MALKDSSGKKLKNNKDKLFNKYIRNEFYFDS